MVPEVKLVLTKAPDVCPLDILETAPPVTVITSGYPKAFRYSAAVDGTDGVEGITGL
jgi:hypothetical protein